MVKVLVIGGGPAGMMAAIACKTFHPDYEVTILERNQTLGMKLRLTGGGRCNVTALVDSSEVIKNVICNGKFLHSALQEFTSQDIVDFFRNRGCQLKVEDHNRVFPKSDNANDILDVFLKEIKNLGIKVEYDVCVKETQSLKYDYLILATGGKSFWKTGSDGLGYTLAKQAGHSITDLYPAEVALVCNDAVIQSKELQGLSFRDVKMTVGKKTLKHDLIITHFGLSGPLALQTSSNITAFPAIVSVDFLPNYSLQQLQTNNELLQELPKRLLRYLKTITNSETELLEQVKSFPFNIYGTKGFSTAFVTRGGVSLKEIEPKSMKSKLDSRISFCGEVMDLSGYTGGFNMTIALVTGYCAGKYVN